ncbi:hypothetical protein Tco_1579388 [Tanacetum coccineum]
MIMVNDEFMQQFEKAHGIFLPYLVSDHRPTIMTIPKGIINKKKSFRFANYVADKDNFIDIVKEGWKHDIRGCQMYKVVQKLNLLKKPLNQLNWQNGNLFERVNALKEKLKDAQSKVDADPFNSDNRKNVVNLVNEYTIVAEDELKLLHQKAWDIIGTDICLAMREFFVSGRILGEINATLIALVPKIDIPNKVSDLAL